MQTCVDCRIAANDVGKFCNLADQCIFDKESNAVFPIEPDQVQQSDVIQVIWHCCSSKEHSLLTAMPGK